MPKSSRFRSAQTVTVLAVTQLIGWGTTFDMLGVMRRWVERGHAPNAVRLALAAPTMDQLDTGLRTLAAMLTAREEDFDSTE